MNKFSLLSVILCLFLIPCFGQEQTLCPNIKILPFDKVFDLNESIPFSIYLDEKSRNLKLEYKWTVSQGKIIEGQGTPSIKVDTSDLSNTTVKSTVEIKGLPHNCASTFSEAAVIIDPPPKGHNCRSYGKVSFSEELGILDVLSSNLLDDGTLPTYHLRTKKNFSAKEIDGFISKRLALLSKNLGIAKDKVIFIFEKSDYTGTKICIWKKGTEELDCKDCKIIKGEDFNLKSFNKNK